MPESDTPIVSSIPGDKIEEAQDFFDTYRALLAVGFTEEQAMVLLSRPTITINTKEQYPPELYEFWERQNAVAMSITDEIKPDDD